MIGIYCFSGSGHSMAVADQLAQLLDCAVTPLGSASPEADVAAVVFPVYCQNIPDPVKTFLKKLEAKHVALIATYGKISYGNVLYAAQKLLQGEVIAGGYIPMGHTFLDGDLSFDAGYLLPIAQRIRAPQKVTLPKTRKNPLADIFPGLRSRMGVAITKDAGCNSCGLCEELCPMGAIRDGRIRANCIRCLRCVTNCPQKALHYKNSWVLRKYLSSYSKEEYMLYL